MLKTEGLNQLNHSHLLLIQKHIELGREHLQKILLQEGVEELCSLDLLNPETEKKIEAAPTELTGTFLVSLNSVLTGALGLWVAVNGFMGFFLTSKLLFQMVLVLSAAVGALVGILDYQLTKREIQKQIEERELQDIQIYILKFLKQKREQEFVKKSGEISKVLERMQIFNIKSFALNECNNPAFLLERAQHIDHLLEEGLKKQDPAIYKRFAGEVEFMREKLKNSFSFQDLPQKPTKNVPPILQSLIHTSLPKNEKKQYWIQKNWKSLLMSGILFLYGSFSSLFSYLTNAYTISEQVGWEKLYFFLSDPRMRIVQFLLAGTITLYFAVCFAVKNRKRFQRDQEIAKTQESIVKKEAAIAELDDSLLKVKEILIYLERLSGVYGILTKISFLGAGDKKSELTKNTKGVAPKSRPVLT